MEEPSISPGAKWDLAGRGAGWIKRARQSLKAAPAAQRELVLRFEQAAGLKWKRAAQGGPFRLQRVATAYFSLASARSASALSVSSHENAVKALPAASFICRGVRPKWP